MFSITRVVSLLLLTALGAQAAGLRRHQPTSWTRWTNQQVDTWMVPHYNWLLKPLLNQTLIPLYTSQLRPHLVEWELLDTDVSSDVQVYLRNGSEHHARQLELVRLNKPCWPDPDEKGGQARIDAQPKNCARHNYDAPSQVAAFLLEFFLVAGLTYYDYPGAFMMIVVFFGVPILGGCMACGGAAVGTSLGACFAPAPQSVPFSASAEEARRIQKANEQRHQDSVESGMMCCTMCSVGIVGCAWLATGICSVVFFIMIATRDITPYGRCLMRCDM
mgnify:CR=1 FL=1